MMFMIPMPPTSRLIDAIPASSSDRKPVIVPNADRSCAWSMTVKSSSAPSGIPWRARSRLEMATLVSGMASGPGRADRDRLDGVARDEVVAQRRERDEHLVVEDALGLEDADHAERHAAHEDVRAHGGLIELERLGGGGADDGDPQAGLVGGTR